ncbi:hypothetical protein SUGI_1144990 [Cryptomeria japonica]|nr:hypothetical protein SUGI_1144990 [Cryptomeria japonica]
MPKCYSPFNKHIITVSKDINTSTEVLHDLTQKCIPLDSDTHALRLQDTKTLSQEVMPAMGNLNKLLYFFIKCGIQGLLVIEESPDRRSKRCTSNFPGLQKPSEGDGANKCCTGKRGNEMHCSRDLEAGE